MKTKILSILALLLTVTQGAWAQTTADIGRVIAADGKMYKTVTLANKVSTASGVVAYVGTAGSVDASASSTHKVIAISLENLPGGTPFCTHSGLWFAQAYTDLGDCLNVTNGLARTNGLANANSAGADHDNGGIDGPNGHLACKAAWKYDKAQPSGASNWFLPTIGQWNLVVKGLMNRNTDIQTSQEAAITHSILSAKVTPCGAEGFPTGANYWTTTEYNGANVWTFYTYQEGSRAVQMEKTSTVGWTRIRPFFTFASASNGYVVEYNANGGSGAPAAQSKTHGTALTLSSTVPTRTGYTFAGWATSAEGAVAYAAGDSYTTDNDIVLYAQWTPTYTADFAAGNDNTGWTIDPASGVEGATVTVSYSGENKVKSVTVKGISAVTSAPTANDLTYTGSAQNLVTAGTATYGTMVYSLDGETYSAAIPTATNAGDYTVYYKVDGGTDYTGTTAQTVDVTITIPGTIALLKSAINSATNLDYINTNALGKYVTATGTLQSTSAGAVGIITYMSKSAVDTWHPDSRIFVLALTDASTGAKQYISDTAEATYTDGTALNGHQVTEHWHSWPSDFPASEAARNYSASLPSGASSWFLPSEGQWKLGGGVSNVMKQTLTASHNYWTSTGNNGANNNGRVYDYTWGGIGSAQRISSYYVRSAFVY